MRKDSMEIENEFVQFLNVFVVKKKKGWRAQYIANPWGKFTFKSSFLIKSTPSELVKVIRFETAKQNR